ncbi:MAG: hypothetical protein ACFFFH_12250 [Candidatus Thorarchaeota archaeon]
MKAPIIVIPTYWKKGIHQKEDSIYDHPTDLLNPEETLSKTLTSLSIIKEDFDVLILGVPTRPSIGKEMDDEILKLIRNLNLPYNPLYFGFKEFSKLKNYLTHEINSIYSNILVNNGYGNIRNLCVLIPHLLSKNISILIDDDEIITNPNFVQIATEFIGKKTNGKVLGLILGFYRNQDGSIYLDETQVPWWELVWNKTKHMNKVFQIIEDENQDRLVDSPFSLGGLMVIHRDCWIKVPFDPLITRGEDMDYLRNAQYFGIETKLDRYLYVIHKPPKSQVSYSMKFKQDIFRFLYASFKLKKFNMNTRDYDPYPGYFLKKTEGKIILTELLFHIFQNQDSLIDVKNREELFKELQKFNSIFDEAKAYAKTNSNFYIKFQKEWEDFISELPSGLPFDIVSRI